MKKLKGGSYDTKHTHSGKLDKKHNIHLQPVPPELLSFAPLGGIDTRYGQLYRNINNGASKAAEIDGFLPHNPFKGIKEHATTLPTGTAQLQMPHFPSLATLNAEMILKWSLNSHNDEIPD